MNQQFRTLKILDFFKSPKFDEKIHPCEERPAGAEGLGAPSGPRGSMGLSTDHPERAREWDHHSTGTANLVDRKKKIGPPWGRPWGSPYFPLFPTWVNRPLLSLPLACVASVFPMRIPPG